MTDANLFLRINNKWGLAYFFARMRLGFEQIGHASRIFAMLRDAQSNCLVGPLVFKG
jgi:hypothetical protein